MSNIAVFYHTSQLPGWQSLFCEQMNVLKYSGLFDAADLIHVGVNGHYVPDLGLWGNDEKIKIEMNPEPHTEETPTLRSLLKFSQENPGYKILYHHMKGIRWLANPIFENNQLNNWESINNWRKYMEFFNVIKWEECVKALDDFYAVGVNLTGQPRLHFSGTFWWSKSDYIVGLDHNLLETYDRHDREFWIGSGGGKYHGMHYTGIDHYRNNYKPENWNLENNVERKYKELKECLCCGNEELREVLDFKYQPLANNNPTTREQPESVYPLKLVFCNKCTHLQLRHAVDPDLMFKNYLYVTGTSQTMKNYLFDFSLQTIKDVGPEFNGKVLDVACNDGTLLDIYKKLGCETRGIDPSENLYEVSSKNHNVELSYLGKEHAVRYSNTFDIVTAQNVMAHNSYPVEFLKICREMVTENGFIYIQNSQADMTINNEFDTIYHEHLSFFSIESFKVLARRAGLTLVEVRKVPIHGNSHVFMLSKNPDAVETIETDKVPLTDELVDNYSLKCYELINNLHSGLLKLKNQGFKIIGYGAAAKGNTLINASGIILDYIIDDNPLKQGLYTPGARIPIVSIEELEKEEGSICIVPLAWNYFEEIKNNCSKFIETKDVIFVKYFPRFEVL